MLAGLITIATYLPMFDEFDLGGHRRRCRLPTNSGPVRSRSSNPGLAPVLAGLDQDLSRCGSLVWRRSDWNLAPVPGSRVTSGRSRVRSHAPIWMGRVRQIVRQTRTESATSSHFRRCVNWSGCQRARAAPSCTRTMNWRWFQKVGPQLEPLDAVSLSRQIGNARTEERAF
jgi:hypothetical protein